MDWNPNYHTLCRIISNICNRGLINSQWKSRSYIIVRNHRLFSYPIAELRAIDEPRNVITLGECQIPIFYFYYSSRVIIHFDLNDLLHDHSKFQPWNIFCYHLLSHGFDILCPFSGQWRSRHSSVLHTLSVTDLHCYHGVHGQVRSYGLRICHVESSAVVVYTTGSFCVLIYYL